MAIRTFGAYGLNNPQANFDRCLTDIADAGFNGVYFFAFDRWTALHDPTLAVFPWKWNTQKKLWDMTEPNLEWDAQTSKLIRTAFEKHLAVGIGIHTQYHLKSWNRFKGMKLKTHPYFENNFHVDIGDDNSKLYNGITFPVKYHWLHWDDVRPARNQFSFYAENAFGQAIMDYVKRLVFLAKNEYFNAKKLHLNPVMFYKVFNEEDIGGDGDRSEIFVWHRQLWKQAGLVPNIDKPFFSNKNIQCSFKDPQFASRTRQSYDGAKWIMGMWVLDPNDGGITTPYADTIPPLEKNFGLGSLLEIHVSSVDDPNDSNLKRYLDMGCTMDKLFVSNDGIPKDPKTFVKESRRLWDAGANDFIYDESVFNPDALEPCFWMRNWKKSFDGHRRIPH